MTRFDRRLWSRFWAISLPYWRGDARWQAWWLLGLLVLLLLGQTGFAVLFNQQTGEFTSALAAGDAERFWRAIKECFVVLVVAVPIHAYFYYVRDRLHLYWRRWLTGHFLADYFRHRAYYELNGSAEIDNPDQRIAEDINTFTQRTLQFLLVLLGAVLQLAAFSGVLWSISRELVIFLIFYALIGTVVTIRFFGRPLIGLNFAQLRREADFRFSLVRIRENAEAIAFYRGEPVEQAQVGSYFNAAFDNFARLIRRQLNLNLFQYAYNFLTIILPSAIIAGRVLSGELEVGRAIQAAGAFAAILAALAVIVDNFESLSRFAAGIERLDSFARLIENHKGAAEAADGRIASVANSRLAVESLNLYTPDRRRLLIRDLSLAIRPGQGVMIVGPSGCGKSSLLRALAGLWHAGSGRVVRPEHGQMLFLPQRPYMLLASLRRQLLYPEQDSEIADNELQALLTRVNLPDLAARFGGFDTELDWAKVLSVGEQQRVAFARVLRAMPRYVILDEATSALDCDNEESLYRELAASGTTMISVGHRSAILKYHARVLVLSGDGGWRLVDAADYDFSCDR